MIRTITCFCMLAMCAAPAHAVGPDWTPSDTYSACSAKAFTRVEGDACLAAEAKRIDALLVQYLDAVRARLAREAADGGSRDALVSFEKIEAAFEEYRRLECAAVYAYWTGGSVRTAQASQCHIRLTVARTHEVWRHFLTYVDRTPPLLPEP